MKIIPLASLFLLSGVHLGLLHAEEPDVVSLPPFTVIADLLTIDYQIKQGVVEDAKVRDVTPGTKLFAAGLRDGDHLVSIFGRKVVGMKQDEVLALGDQPATPERPKTWRFVRKRGLIRHGKTIDITFTVSPKKPEPNQTSEPIPPRRDGSP